MQPWHTKDGGRRQPFSTRSSSKGAGCPLPPTHAAIPPAYRFVLLLGRRPPLLPTDDPLSTSRRTVLATRYVYDYDFWLSHFVRNKMRTPVCSSMAASLVGGTEVGWRAPDAHGAPVRPARF